MTIREATHADGDAVIGALEWLFAAPGSPPVGWDPDRARKVLAAWIDGDRAAVLVAEDEHGAVIGLATVALDLESIRFGQRAWLEDLAVDPARRSAGVGRALLDAAAAWAREHGASHMALSSGLGRLDAHRFYERAQPTETPRMFQWKL